MSVLPKFSVKGHESHSTRRQSRYLVYTRHSHNDVVVGTGVKVSIPEVKANMPLARFTEALGYG